jgi:hypothetical protein
MSLGDLFLLTTTTSISNEYFHHYHDSLRLFQLRIHFETSVPSFFFFENKLPISKSHYLLVRQTNANYPLHRKLKNIVFNRFQHGTIF